MATDSSNTVSRSGPICQMISVLQKRLSTYLEELEKTDLKFAFDSNISVEENVSSFEDGIYILKNLLKKITGAGNSLKEQNLLWAQLQKELSEEEIAAEAALYDQWTSSPDNFIEVMIQGSEAKDMIESKITELQDTILKLQPARTLPMVGGFGSGLPIQAPAVSFAETSIRVQLPKLELPTYSGDPLRWLEFWDSFNASVHQQDIPQVQKFNYLLSCLRGSAYKAIEGMAVTNVNYKDAVAILQQRFGDVNVIKRTLYAELRNIVKSTNRTFDLRRTAESIDRVTRQLKSLGEDLDQPTLVMLILEKLPTEILIDLGKLKPANQMWSIDELSNNLHNLISIREEAFQIGHNSQTSGFEQKWDRSKPQQKEMGQKKTETFAVSEVEKSKGKWELKNKKITCDFCHGDHFSDQCSKFDNNMARKKRIKDNNLCFRCLRTGHPAKKCTFNRPCFYCSGNHHRALCEKKNETGHPEQQTYISLLQVPRSETIDQKQLEQQSLAKVERTSDLEYKKEKEISREQVTSVEVIASPQLVNSSVTKEQVNVALMVADLEIINMDQQEQKSIVVPAFFDSGSQSSFITNELKDILGLQALTKEVLSINTFASKHPYQIESSNVNLGIRLIDGNIKRITVNAVPTLTKKLKTVTLDNQDYLSLEKGKLKNHTFEKKKPHLLIGIDYFWELLGHSSVDQLPSGIFAIKSKVGLIFSGKQWEEESLKKEIQVTTVLQEGEETGLKLANLESLWDLEAIGIRDSPDLKDEEEALKRFNDGILFQDGRYHIKWPWRSDRIELNDNFGIALGRLKGLINRLKDQPELLLEYDKIIKDQLSKGIIEKVEDDKSNRNLCHYLPHHAVVTPTKTTTKLRIVYDASAKSRKSAKSLNECLYPGPSMIPDLCGMLLQFRMQRIAIVADIEKAFLQIGIQMPDRDVTRFLWLIDPTTPMIENNLQCYRFCRMTFGVISSPFLLNATLKYHLQQAGTPISLKIAQHLYVDNIIIGCATFEEAKKLYQEAKEVFNKASFNLREWTSNSKEFREIITPEDRQRQVETKVLGLIWNTEEDTLRLQINSPGRGKSDPLTKRIVLQELASTFDPLGLLSPIMLKAKIFLQNLWKEKVSWDEELDHEKVEQWQAIRNQWLNNDQFVIQRPVPHNFENVEFQLIAFSDASKSAFATAIYLKTSSSTGTTSTSLVYAKNRLAPCKQITIPRLELMGALIATRGIKFVEENLGVTIKGRTLFIDSECVLHWLNEKKPLSTFVTNRIKEIKSAGNINFCYVPSKENPADIASRGCQADDFKTMKLWWQGPVWLKEDCSAWPQDTITKSSDGIAEYAIQNVETEATSHNIKNLIDLNRISSWQKAKRIMVYVLRFIKIKVRAGIQNQELQALLAPVQVNQHISAEEIQLAEKVLVRNAQQRHYPEFFEEAQHQKNKKLAQLGVQIHASMLRCYGRLENADIANSTKFPLLLPSKDRLTELIVLNKHQEVMHFGTSHTLSQVRQEYWIPKGRSVVKKIIGTCIPCKKQRGGPFKLPPMASLPADRLKRARPFQYIGLDYFGPLNIKSNQENEEPYKIWICLFTCLVTRAIHLEYVNDLKATTFLNCLRRFIARRGTPSKILSDNAPQFKMADRIINTAINNSIKSEEVSQYFATKKIQWKFIVEMAPWQGGIYERLIGLTKRAMKQAIGRRMLTLEEMLTLLPEIEAVINSRPLTYVGEEIEEINVLRPIDFLIPFGEIGIPVLEEDQDDPDFIPEIESRQKFTSYWRKSQQILDKFWALWYTEYLLSLRERLQQEHLHPRVTTKKMPEVGEVVLLHDENLTRGSWKIAKIVEINDGRDRNIRSAKVLLPNKNILQRPINKLFPLEIISTENGNLDSSENYNSEEDDNVAQHVEVEVQTRIGDSGQTVSEAFKKLAKITLKSYILMILFISFIIRAQALPEQIPEIVLLDEENSTTAFIQKSSSVMTQILKLKMESHRTSASTRWIATTTLSPTAFRQTVYQKKKEEGSSKKQAISIEREEISLNKHQCPSNAILQTMHSEECVKSGITIKRLPSRDLCWIRSTCPMGHLRSDGKCGIKCLCPDWSQDCSRYNGLANNRSENQEEILALAKPNICSFLPSKGCDTTPIHTTMAQIQLYDGSLHLVKNLQLMYQTGATKQFRCIGEGPLVGTPDFCSEHECQQHGTKLCYYHQDEIVKFINEHGGIPVQAWGVIPITFFGPPTKPEIDMNCTKCKLECLKGGTQITIEDKVGLIEICVQPYCYKISNPQEKEDIIFPGDAILNDYEVTAKVWKNGYLIKDIGVRCSASPFCEMINCYLCKELLFNPHCAPMAYLILIFMGAYFSTGALYYIFKLLRLLIVVIYTIGKIVFYLIRCCIRPIGHLGRMQIRSSQQMVQRAATGQFNYRPSVRHSGIVLVMAVFCPAEVLACSQVTTLTAQSSTCNFNSNQTSECTMSETTRLSLMPQGQETCLLIKNAKSEPIGTITIEVLKIKLGCQVHSDYFTRSYAMKVESSKRCPGMGSCIGTFCENTTTSTKIEELKNSNDKLGFTYCVESCGCAACGCFACSSSCLFYRTYAIPESPATFEIFSCPAWEYLINIDVHINFQKEKVTEIFTLKPGGSLEWNNLKLSIPSVSLPAVPFLGSQFMTDGSRTIMVKASASGQPVSGTVGSLQCETKQKADTFNCYLPHDICNCQGRESTVTCNCADMALEPLFTKLENLLPVELHGISISGSGKDVTADFKDIAALEIQITMEGFKISTKIEKNVCTIIPMKLSGCYACITGAKLEFECKTDFGEALAHVTCGPASFSVNCGALAKRDITTLNFPKSSVNEKCAVYCPGGKTNFEINGTLIYINKERIGNLTNIIAAPSTVTGGRADWGSIGNFFSMHWLASAASVIGAIILAVATLYILPYMLRMLSFLVAHLSKIRSSKNRAARNKQL